MRWLTISPRKGDARPSSRRRIRPTLDDLEGRRLLTYGTFISLDNANGIASEVVTHNALGQEEVFMRLDANNAVFEYNYSTKNLTFTGGYLDQMVADDGGIAGIGGGLLFHYQDGSGYAELAGGVAGIGGITSVVITHNASNQEEAFARIGQYKEIWEYNFSTHIFTYTGGSLDQIMPADGGIAGLVGGNLWLYRDGTQYSYTGGNGISSAVVTHNQAGQEVLFARLAANGEVFDYNAATGQWADTHGQLDQMVPNAVGITGTLGGALFTYSFGTNYNFTGATNVTSVVVSHDPGGREEAFVGHADGSLWDYVYSANEWNVTGDKLDQMVADDDGVTGTTGGSLAYLYHYRDNNPDFGLVGPDFRLGQDYIGNFNATYQNLFNLVAAPQSTSGSIYLSLHSASKSLLGYEVTGQINVIGSVFSFSESFVGTYVTSSPLSTTPVLTIQNASPNRFSFQIAFNQDSSGNLIFGTSEPAIFDMLDAQTLNFAEANFDGNNPAFSAQLSRYF